MNHLLSTKKSTSIMAGFLLILYANFMVSCSYYRVKTLDPLSQESVAGQMKNKMKYVILHQGGSAWHLKDIVLDNDGRKITGVIEPLPANHQYYKTAKPAPKANRYRHKNYQEKIDKPIHEIHIYTTTEVGTAGAPVTISFSDIEKVEVYDPHTGAQIAVIVGSLVAAVVVLAIIVASTKSSCPFVYIDDGVRYSFAGEMYGGAIYPSLERDDYMPLPGFQAYQDMYRLTIANELLEKQYINKASLLIANHPENTEVLIDKRGAAHTLASPQLPATALSASGTVYNQQIAVRDSLPYLFHESGGDDQAVSSLILSFKRPADSNTGKLVINAKNSYWLDHVYGQFNSLFGMYYNTFAEQQKKEPAGKLTRWSLEQNIPLSVYVETAKGWKLVDYFNSIGPLASRDLVMPVDLTQLPGEEVRIKLECGFMFWEVDYAAMDFSPNISVDVTPVAAASATDQDGKDVADLLYATDARYLAQPDVGNSVTLHYPATRTTAGLKQTVFLHSRGYYEYIRDYETIPNFSYLKSFKEKGAFTRFAKERYHAFVNDQTILAAALTQEHED